MGLHAILCDELYLYGVGGICRLSREIVQHRRRRSGDVGRARYRAHRALYPMATLECCADRLYHWGRIAWGRMGLYSRDFAGKTWISHRDHYNYVQLHRICTAKLFIGERFASSGLYGPGDRKFSRGHESADTAHVIGTFWDQIFKGGTRKYQSGRGPLSGGICVVPYLAYALGL